MPGLSGLSHHRRERSMRLRSATGGGGAVWTEPLRVLLGAWRDDPATAPFSIFSFGLPDPLPELFPLPAMSLRSLASLVRFSKSNRFDRRTPSPNRCGKSIGETRQIDAAA